MIPTARVVAIVCQMQDEPDDFLDYLLWVHDMSLWIKQDNL